MKHNNSIYLEDKHITLKTSQTENISGIKKKKIDMSIWVYNDKITSNISMIITISQNTLMKRLSAPIRYDIRY